VAQNKKSPAAIAGYAVVFVLLGVALYWRRDMIKDFIGIKPSEAEAYARSEENQRRREEEGKDKPIDIDDLEGLEDIAKQFKGDVDEKDGEGKDGEPAKDIPMPGAGSGSPKDAGTGGNVGAGATHPGDAAGDAARQEAIEEGLKGAYVEVIGPTEIYQGRRVLARAPKGIRFRVLDERMDEEGNRWLMVPFRRKGGEQPVSGWIRWDAVTLAPPPTQAPEKEGEEGEQAEGSEEKEEGGEEQ